MTSKQRAYLKGLAMTMEPIFQIGKSSLTPENTQAISEALAARELIKISVLNNCMDDPRELAQMVAERTHAQVVQVIGKKIVLYREGKDEKKKIVLPCSPYRFPCGRRILYHGTDSEINDRISVWLSENRCIRRQL